MPIFTFSIPASLSIEASSEEEARTALYRSLCEEDEDIPYGVGMAYIASDAMLAAKLVDVFNSIGEHHA